jgi:DnaK suppressor protein
MAETDRTATALDDATREELRTRLEGERTRLLNMLRALRREEQGGEIHDPLAADPEDFGEMGQDITNQETDLALSANDQRLLAQVERALQRMSEGTYGLSEVTGKPIPLERLLALPWATTNVDDRVRS